MDIGTINHTGNLSQVALYSHSAHALPGKEVSEGSAVPDKKTNPQTLSFSDEARRLSREPVAQNGQTQNDQKELQQEKQSETDKNKVIDPNQPTSSSGQPLSDSEQQELQELKRRDAEVKAHEQAHLSAAGNLAQGAVNFAYETGPDGNRYAVGGDVSIDTSEVSGDPRATLLKAQRIRRAASAPVDPSSQDRSVAAQASRMEAQARIELSEQGREKQQQYIDENSPELDLFSSRINQNEKDIQNTYTKIQNTSVLEAQKSFVDFFI